MEKADVSYVIMNRWVSDPSAPEGRKMVSEQMYTKAAYNKSVIALKQSREALLACYNSVDPRSPAGKQLALALEMIKEILE